MPEQNDGQAVCPEEAGEEESEEEEGREAGFEREASSGESEQ